MARRLDESPLLVSSPSVKKELLALSMIVKDEAATIARTLASVKPFVDRWVIVDTGSTDGTQAAVRAALEGVPGELHEDLFVDFSTSRNGALDLAGTSTAYVMWLDADDELEGGADLRTYLSSKMDEADRDAHLLRIAAGGVHFDSCRVFRAGSGWHFRGAVHEMVVHTDGLPPQSRVPGVTIRRGEADVRSRRRWERDADVLARVVLREPDDARSTFYLGLTYLWLERWDDAEATLRRRVALGGWAEEVYHSKVALARVATGRGDPWREILLRWLDAHDFAPHRAEPLHAIALHYNAHEQHALTFLFAKRGAELPLPAKDKLFVEEEVYVWKLADLVASAGYWIGEFAAGEAAARTAAAQRPNDARLARNLEFYLRRGEVGR